MAFEGLTRAWAEERVLARDGAVVLVDKPAGVAPAADAGGDASWGVSLPERLFVHGLGPVQVIFSPPERASGVALVGLGAGVAGEPVSPGALPEEIGELCCVVACDGWSLSASGVLGVRGPGGLTRVAYRVTRRQGTRVLVELEGRLSPEALLSALSGQGQRVVGAAGAPAATRLMLHVRRLQGGVAGEAPLPPEFHAWLAGAAEVPPERFASALERARVVRHGLERELGAYRLLSEEAGEIAGVSVERYGDFAVLYVSSPEAERHERAMASCLMDYGARGVYVKRRVRADLRGVDPARLAPGEPLLGSPAPERFEVRQGPLAFQVSLADGLATGLFLDQRANWDRVRGSSSGASLLNLFCYTGAFTIAAAAGGAASTISVDLAGRALSRVKANLELNGLSGAHHRLLKADVPAWLARAGRAGRRFGCVVLDPPSFGTRAHGVLSTRRDQPALLAAAVALLEPGGRLLAVSHHRKISESELARLVADACAELGRSAQIEALVGGWDCPSLPGVSGTKSVLARVR